MANKTTKVTLSEESVDAIAKVISDVIFDLLNGFLIPLREDLQEVKSSTDRINASIDRMMSLETSDTHSGGLVNVCPDIPDNWRGGRSETARILGIALRTLDVKAALGKRNGGIDWLPGRRGKIFTGKEIKRFWRDYR